MGKQVKTRLNKTMADNNIRNNRNNNINTEDLFAESGFEGRNWKVVSTQKVSESPTFKDKVEKAIIRDGHFINEDGEEQVIKNVVLIMIGGKSKSWKLSPLGEQFKAGTKLDVQSLELQKIMDEDTGDTYYNMSAEAL